MQDIFEMLQELLEQQQFELLIEECYTTPGDIPLVYLMNDAVESFLVFKQAKLTGSYIKDYEGSLKASLSQEEEQYVLVVWQGDNVVTVFFKDLDLEVHLYNYGEIGHFWVPGYEYLRQLEYRLAIARDKLEYLGAEFCTETEKELVQLTDFPPLNYCCYPAVPKKYIVPKEDAWIPSEQAFEVMENLAEEVKDTSLLRLLKVYRYFPYPVTARWVARAFHRNSHAAIIDLLTQKIKKEASVYPDRCFGEEVNTQLKQLLTKAKKLQEKLKEDGIKAEILREEPFTTARDNLDFQVFLMVWKKGGRNRKVEIKKLMDNNPDKISHR